jgi:hypothetical protein
MGGQEKQPRDPERKWPFWDRVEKTENCWFWKGSHRGAGYGSVIRNGRQIYAHRYSFEQSVGLIPEGCHIHHRCGNKLCVRPDHLELVTANEHWRITAPPPWNRGITHCKRGHEFTPETTRITSQGSRQCRLCEPILQAAYRMRKKQGGRAGRVSAVGRENEEQKPRRRPEVMDCADRFWSKVQKSGGGGCWPWMASRFRCGYGKCSVNGDPDRYAHRWAWRLSGNTIPERMQIDHLCHNRACCNPAHLEVVTQAENIARAAAMRPRKTTCLHGHPRVAENLLPNGGCRTCNRIRSREAARRRRAAGV